MKSIPLESVIKTRKQFKKRVLARMHKNTFNHEWSSKKATSDLELNTKSMKMDKNSYAIKELAFPA